MNINGYISKNTHMHSKINVYSESDIYKDSKYINFMLKVDRPF